MHVSIVTDNCDYGDSKFYEMLKVQSILFCLYPCNDACICMAFHKCQYSEVDSPPPPFPNSSYTNVIKAALINCMYEMLLSKCYWRTAHIQRLQGPAKAKCKTDLNY